MSEQTFQLKEDGKLLPKTSIPQLNQTLLRMGQADNFVSDQGLIGGFGHFATADLRI
jgi:hypothetical protein